jgi:hypothetical protein
MTLLEQTYEHLSRAGLTSSAEAFSRDYLGKSRSWFAYQKHAGRDYSVAAAIQCLRVIKDRLQSQELDIADRTLLVRTAEQLQLHLSIQYSIADVC